jgi:hypothetical protein
MRRSLMLVAILLQACDPPAPPAKQGTVPPAPAGPPAGVLRLDRSERTAPDLLKKRITPGLPSLAVRLMYPGPRTHLEIQLEAWHQGKKEAGETDHQLFHLPLSDDAAFGFAEGMPPEGKAGTQVVISMPVQSAGSEGGSSRTTSSLQFGVPLLKARTVDTYRPSWPLDVPDGKEVVLWAVFVDEPADAPTGASLEERAKRADTAWIFRIRTADEKK